MKRIISVVLAVLIFASLVFTAFAAEGVFTPSVTAKPAPEVVTKNEVAGAPVVEIVNDKDETVATYDVVNVVVTPVSKVEDETVAEEVRTVLADTYKELSAPDVKLAEAMPALTEVVAEAAKADETLKNLDVNTLVVKDLFDVAVSEELSKTLEVEGNFLSVTLDAKVAENQFIVVMVLVDGEWVPVDFVVNEDGTITCKMNVVGVVAILTKA